MFFLFISWLLLQIAYAGFSQCSISCHNSTSSGNSCCMCTHMLCRSTCSENKESCYNCNKRMNIGEALMFNFNPFQHECFRCHDYEHIPSGECMSCPVGCASCYDNTLCYECVNNMYGTICNKRCGKCRPIKKDVNSCHFIYGTCINGCVDGYYSLRCEQVCGHCKPDKQGVVKCDYDSGTCTNGCVDGYYSPRCDRVCEHCKPDNQGVVKCNSDSGACTNGCVDGYYSSRCDRVCGVTCSKRVCSQQSGFCDHGCVSGWHGATCRESCSSTCYNKSCDQYSGYCTNGCVLGWYGNTCNETCSDTCSLSSCNQWSGICEKGCVSGWHGDTCGKSCSDTCSLSSCNQNSGFCVNGCVSGWLGDTCRESCSSTCYNKLCDQYSGYCANGCVLGWYGDTCNKTCSDTCFLSLCNQMSGFCEEGCISGCHGYMCELLCSSTCYNKSCDQYSGRCYNGCATAYYGDTCEFNCVDTCKEHVCDRETSQCLRGCVAGYEGAFCNMTMNTGPDSVLVGFTSSLAGFVILLVFTLSIWYIRRVVRGKRYGNLQMTTRDTSVPIYDEISDIDDRTVVHRVCGSHLYMDVGTTHTLRSTYEPGPTKRSNSDTEIAGNRAKTLAVVETFHDTPLVCASALSMSTLHSEVRNYNNSGVIHTHSLISLDNAELHRKSSNRSRKYYEIPDIIPGVNHNVKNKRSDTNDGFEIPISSVSSTAQNAEAGGAGLSGQCNRITDFATSTTRDSKRTQSRDIFSSRNNEIDVNDINQTLQKVEEDKCNSDMSGYIDIPQETHHIQGKVTEGDSASLNYIHPVN